MTPQELRNSILLSAIQGKLVEQRSEEGTGEELFQSISFAEKKPLKNISEAEIPYELPNSWKWVRHNTLFEIVGGSQPPKSHFLDNQQAGCVRLYQIRDYGDKPVPVYVPEKLVTKFTKKGDILLARYGASVGKVFLAEDGAYNVAMAKVTPLFTGEPICKMFLFYYYLAPLYQFLVKNNTRSAQAGFNKEDLNDLLFPLPPLEEQKRIVAKLEELLPLIDRYEVAWNKLEEFNKRFPGDMQKSILQLAIQGKLVKQLQSDEDVDAMLASIKQKREKLISEKKLKVLGKINKRTSVELDIPDNWRFVCLSELICKRVDNRGKTPPHSPVKNERYCIDLLEINAIIPGASINHSNVEKFIDEETRSSLRGHIEEDDILIATVGSIGKFAMMDSSKSAIAQNIIAIKCFEEVEQKYIFYLLQSPYFYTAIGNITMEAVQASIKVPDLMNLQVPLPPLAEQKRIVAKLEEILPLCERLK